MSRIGYYAERTNIPTQPVSPESAPRPIAYIKVEKVKDCPCRQEKECVVYEVGVDDK
jgi:hypothetical protein